MSEKIKLSVIMGMEANPDIRIMVIQHGECLDDESLQIIEDLAKDRDYQLLVEFMTRDDADEEKCQIVMVEGKEKVSELRG